MSSAAALTSILLIGRHAAAEGLDTDVVVHASGAWASIPNLSSWRRGPGAAVGADFFIHRVFGVSAEATVARLLVLGVAPDDAAASTLITLGGGPVLRLDVGPVTPFLAVHGALTLDDGVLGDPERPADSHFALRASLGLEFAPRERLRIAAVGDWGAVAPALLAYPAWAVLRVRVGWTSGPGDW